MDKPISQMTTEERKFVSDYYDKKEKTDREQDRKDYEAEKTAFIEGIVSRFDEYNAALQELKSSAIAEARKLNGKVYELNGKAPKEAKSFQLKTADDKMKIVVENQERFEFTEEAQVHIEGIKEIFKNKFADRNKGMYKFLDAILMKNGKGDYDPKLLTKARNQAKELGDDALVAEFEKLTDCQRVTETSTYIRVYKKDDKGKYQDVSLNFSAL